MNNLELEALSANISNNARVLYCIYLVPNFCKTKKQCLINNKAIINLLNKKEKTISLGRDVTALIYELYQAGLVLLPPDTTKNKSLHNKYVSLPLVQVPKSNLINEFQYHDQHSPMTLDWQPPYELFDQLCKLMMFKQIEYSKDDLGEFISYWIGRIDTTQTSYQWTRKFVIHLKNKRPSQNPIKTNSKTPESAGSSSIVYDSNTAKLVSQYKKQNNKG